MPRREGGLIVIVRGERRFIPARVAVSVLARPVISRVPGSSIGMTLFSGRVVPVIDLGGDRRELVVCDLGDESIALAGLEVAEAGFFEVDERGALTGDVPAPLFDVAAEACALEAELSSPRMNGGAG